MYLSFVHSPISRPFALKLYYYVISFIKSVPRLARMPQRNVKNPSIFLAFTCQARNIIRNIIPRPSRFRPVILL